MSYTQHPNHWPTKQVRLGRSPKPRQGPSPWTSILVRDFDEVLSGAQLPLEHGVPFLGDFVRQAASETLHDSGLAAFGEIDGGGAAP